MVGRQLHRRSLGPVEPVQDGTLALLEAQKGQGQAWVQILSSPSLLRDMLLCYFSACVSSPGRRLVVSTAHGTLGDSVKRRRKRCGLSGPLFPLSCAHLGLCTKRASGLFCRWRGKV